MHAAFRGKVEVPYHNFKSPITKSPSTRFRWDDCGSAAVNEDTVLRELQRRVEDFAAALLLRIGS
jgi:hypothetical protein